MKRALPFLLLAVPAAAAPTPSDLSVTRIGDRPGWFLCDGIDAPRIALIGKPAAGGAVAIGTLSKAHPAAPVFATYRVGTPDPGAGQVYWTLTRNGREAGNLHAFNPAALADGLTARTPPFTSIETDGRRMQCRWLADTRFIGVTERRSVIVRGVSSGRLTYESFDYDKRSAIEMPDGVQRTTQPSQRVTGGHASITAASTRFAFTNAGYDYVITVRAGKPGTLTVGRGGRIVGTERLIAYTLAR